MIETHKGNVTQIHSDPIKNLEVLKNLKQEVDQIIKEHPEKAANHWIKNFSEELQFLIARRKYQTFGYKKLPQINFEELNQIARAFFLRPITGLKERIDAFRNSLSEQEEPNLVYVFEQLHQLKTFIINEIVKNKRFSGQWVYVNQSLTLIEGFELGIANKLLSHGAPLSEEATQLMRRIALSQGILEERAYDVESLRNTLEQERNERMIGYSDLRRQLINTPHFIDLLSDHGYFIDEAIQVILGKMKGGLYSLLDQLLADTQTHDELGGFPTCYADVIGRVRFVQNEEFSTAEEGEILVIENASPEVHKYAHATAIVSREGGIFSHAAITFNDLQIPALLGCNISLLREYDGCMVHLHLSKKSQLTPLKESVQEFHRLTPEAFHLIDSFDEGIRNILKAQLLKKAYEKLPPTDFAHLPYAEEYLIGESKKIKDLFKHLCKAENPIQKEHFRRKYEKGMGKLLEASKEINPAWASELEEENLMRNRGVPFQSLTTCVSLFEKGGKKENLDRLKLVLTEISIPLLAINVPEYTDFHADELIWQKYPLLKQEIRDVLRSSLSFAEKNRKILDPISRVEFDPDDIFDKLPTDGDLIVRSSVPLEDQVGKAGAGIFTSVPIKNKTELADAFFKVLTSLFSEKALAFFDSQDVKDENLLLDFTWIVQRYVSDGTYSGVAFSAIDEVNWEIVGMQLVNGLGGGVDGTKTPSHISVDSSTMTLSDLHVEKGKRLPCSITIAKAIALFVKKLEEKFNTAVEIEFVGKEDHLSVVQMRPITHIEKSCLS